MGGGEAGRKINVMVKRLSGYPQRSQNSQAAASFYRLQELTLRRRIEVLSNPPRLVGQFQEPSQ